MMKADAYDTAAGLCGRGPTRRLADELTGRAMPNVRLKRWDGSPLDLARLAELGVVVYLYPAVTSSPDGLGDSAAEDSAQHRLFDKRTADLRAHSLRVVGVSNETPHAELVRAAEHRVVHPLLSDPELQLANTLGLPTFTSVDGVRCYRRLVIVAIGGQISKVFYPVTAAHRSADQVLAWLRATGQ